MVDPWLGLAIDTCDGVHVFATRYTGGLGQYHSWARSGSRSLLGRAVVRRRWFLMDSVCRFFDLLCTRVRNERIRSLLHRRSNAYCADRRAYSIILLYIIIIILHWLPGELNIIIIYNIITRSYHIIYVGGDVRVDVLGEKSATSSLRRTRGRGRIMLDYYYYYKAYNNIILKYCVRCLLYLILYVPIISNAFAKTTERNK